MTVRPRPVFATGATLAILVVAFVSDAYAAPTRAMISGSATRPLSGIVDFPTNGRVFTSWPETFPPLTLSLDDVVFAAAVDDAARTFGYAIPGLEPDTTHTLVIDDLQTQLVIALRTASGVDVDRPLPPRDLSAPARGPTAITPEPDGASAIVPVAVSAAEPVDRVAKYFVVDVARYSVLAPLFADGGTAIDGNVADDDAPWLDAVVGDAFSAEDATIMVTTRLALDDDGLVELAALALDYAGNLSELSPSLMIDLRDAQATSNRCACASSRPSDGAMLTTVGLIMLSISRLRRQSRTSAGNA